MKYRKNIRLKEYDYASNGYYFVTICTRKFFPFLKFFKSEIEKSIMDLPQYISGLKVDYFVVMDNHIHIIFIFENCSRPLGRVVAAIKAQITKIVAGDVSRLKKDVGLRQPLQKMGIWERNYYEHVIRNEKALQKIRKYIVENPEVERLKFEEFYEK